MSSITGTQPTQVAQLGPQIRGAGTDMFRDAMIRGALTTHDPQRAAASIQRDMSGERPKYTPEQARQTLTEIADNNKGRPVGEAAAQVRGILFPTR